MSGLPRPDSAVHTPSRVGRAPGAISVSLRTTAALLRAQVWLWPLIALALLAFLGTWVRAQVERPLRDAIESRLSATLDADVAALQLWMYMQRRAAAAFASGEAVRNAALALAPFGSAPAALLQSPEQAAMRDRFDAINDPPFYNGFALFDPGGRVLASNAPELIGAAPYVPAPSWLTAALSGKPAVSAPFESRVLLEDAAGQVHSGVPTIFIAAPVRDAQGAVAAAAALRVRPQDHFAEILSLARTGETGETFAVGRDGMLLSPSRFEETLKRLALMPGDAGATSALAVPLRDPGVDLAAGERPQAARDAWPLTRMAESLRAGRSGVDASGYRSYLGVEVAGAWRWLDDAGFGVGTELAVAEMYAPLAVLNRVFWGMYAAAAAAAAAIYLLGLYAAKQQRAARQAALDAMQLGQYTLDDRIGAGGMGVVYRAHHALLRRPTAVKLLHAERTTPETIARFAREVDLTSRLTHPNTITVYDYGRTPEGIFYYAMEYLDGLTLQDLVDRFGPLDGPRTIHLLRQVCASLAEAHAAGLVHRDVKPANIMVLRRAGLYDFVKVLDFGLARAADAANLTADGAWAGSPAYMAPEAFSAPDSVDARTDLFAAGAVGYFLLTGGPLFRAGSVQALVHMQATAAAEPLSARAPAPVAPDLEAVLMACLERDPGARPASAAALEETLAACADAGRWSGAAARAWWASRFEAVVNASTMLGPPPGDAPAAPV